MKEANKDIRAEIDNAGLKYWQVAAQLDVHPTTFTVWLRTPLDEDKTQQVQQAINELKTELARA